MSRKRNLYEVVVLLTAKQIQQIQVHTKEEWSFSRKLIKWWVDYKLGVIPEIPVKELLVEGESLYVIPEDEAGQGMWKVKSTDKL
jgi:hypothetical protein